METAEKRKCKLAHCNIYFTPTREWQLFCCREHRSAHYWETHAIIPVTSKPYEDTFDPLVAEGGDEI